MSRKIASILHFRIFLLLFLSLPLNNILVLVAQPPSSVTVGQPAVAPTRASFRGGNPGGMGRSLTSSRASSATINSSIASSVNFTTHDELHLLSSSDTPTKQSFGFHLAPSSSSHSLAKNVTQLSRSPAFPPVPQLEKEDSSPRPLRNEIYVLEVDPVSVEKIRRFLSVLIHSDSDKYIGLRQVRAIFNATNHLSPHGLPDLPHPQKRQGLATRLAQTHLPPPFYPALLLTRYLKENC